VRACLRAQRAASTGEEEYLLRYKKFVAGVDETSVVLGRGAPRRRRFPTGSRSHARDWQLGVIYRDHVSGILIGWAQRLSALASPTRVIRGVDASFKKLIFSLTHMFLLDRGTLRPGRLLDCCRNGFQSSF